MLTPIISPRAASDLGTDAEYPRDVARAILRAERREPGSWLPYDVDAAAEWLGCDADTSRAILREIADAHADEGGDLCSDTDDTGCCSVCGVLLDRCAICGGVGYHRVSCPEVERAD